MLVDTLARADKFVRDCKGILRNEWPEELIRKTAVEVAKKTHVEIPGLLTAADIEEYLREGTIKGLSPSASVSR